MEEVNDQQAQLVTDVQTRLLVLEKRMEELQPGHPSEPRTVAVPPPVRSILWVDDNPRNNAILSQRFSELGIQVVTALSTASAIAECNRQRYDRIITDMGRKEGGAYNSTAGLDLIRQIRALEPAIPIVVYCSAGAARRYRGEALAAGAIEITASPTTLIDALNIDPKQTGNI
jgi:CheY-like chemotaxis protein